MAARTIAGGALVALLALGLAACSDNSGLTGNQKQDISSFKANGNAICANANAQLHAALDQGKAATANAASAKTFLVDTYNPIAEKLVGDLHNLGEPTLDRAAWDDIRGQVDQSLSDLKAATDRDPVATLQQLLAQPRGVGTSALDKAFSNFGLTECAKD